MLLPTCACTRAADSAYHPCQARPGQHAWRTPLHAQAGDAALLEALDARGLGVRTRVEREFYTQLATLVVVSTWTGTAGPTTTTCSAGAEASGHAHAHGPHEPHHEPSGLLEARRAALLAVFQENLVLRSRLVGKVVDCLVALRPGYLPADVVQRVRRAWRAWRMQRTTTMCAGWAVGCAPLHGCGPCSKALLGRDHACMRMHGSPMHACMC